MASYVLIAREQHVYLQQLNNVASTEHSMSNGELDWLRRRKVRREDAFVNAPAAKNLARGTRGENDRW